MALLQQADLADGFPKTESPNFQGLKTSGGVYAMAMAFKVESLSTPGSSHMNPFEARSFNVHTTGACESHGVHSLG